MKKLTYQSLCLSRASLMFPNRPPLQYGVLEMSRLITLGARSIIVYIAHTCILTFEKKGCSRN